MQVVAVSTDTEHCHLAWTNTPRTAGGVGRLRIPLLSDKGGEMARAFGCYKEEEVSLAIMSHNKL